MTLQPSQSGHYIYSFSHLSDANYNKVELKGPTIEQMVHPLASAIFAGSSGRDRMTINSCSENTFDVDVSLTVGIHIDQFQRNSDPSTLQGIGPWNLTLQLVGPQKSETVSFSGIETARRRLQVGIPKGVNREGGSVEINISGYHLPTQGTLY